MGREHAITVLIPKEIGVVESTHEAVTGLPIPCCADPHPDRANLIVLRYRQQSVNVGIIKCRLVNIVKDDHSMRACEK